MHPLMDPGQGVIHCGVVAGQPVLHQCASKYPLKLITPRVHHRSPGDPIKNPPALAVYVLTYGGGIVHGDVIHLRIVVDNAAVLTLLTQGSTKVFRHWPRGKVAMVNNPQVVHSLELASPLVLPMAESLVDKPEHQLGKEQVNRCNNGPSPLKKVEGAVKENPPSTETLVDTPPPPSRQFSLNHFTVHVASGGCLVSLPSPVTCFKNARYQQRQDFHLEDTSSSLVLLDWVTSGRVSRGEAWQFDMYSSTNSIYVNDKLVFKDAVHLSDKFSPLAPDQTTLKVIPALTGPLEAGMVGNFVDRVGHFQCFAMLTLMGEKLASLIHSLVDLQDRQRIMASTPASAFSSHIRNPQKRQQDYSLSSMSSGLVYTMSYLDPENTDSGLVVRLSAYTSESIIEWIRTHLADLETMIGVNIWKSVLN
ncbi:hypothetical protein IWQ62_004521 [Dispira parvispora]|uniref:Urease accessory protein D n=1 Tax=Dispira parvispora TaxID=1520584 RepID=A0A9W8E625_9FUNG|nr:hypothetical protein IWQ62_004521 [Dispira parvispora]